MTANITCAGCTHAYADTALFCPNCGRPKVRDFGGDVLLGKVLGERFQVQEQLGQGASGTIYRAEHITLRRKVAIKVLHNELSRDDLAVERFRREATTVAEIDNEHIVEIHDFGRAPDGRLYLAMELLEGETLDAVLARERTLSVERAADVLIQVGEALMEAHAIGYVHRDLRPRNLYLAVRRGKANFVKLLDFGLAKLVETDASAASTSLGMTFGDPRYMSPEQARGDRIDRRADIYQLGCIAYEMLTGAPPFSGSRVFDILTKQVTEVPQPLPSRRRDVPLWMEAAVTKMLAKDPDNRFATTTRMVEALRRGLETGEVMEDEVARRRESIPPPSVSRVMHKMGLSQPIDPAPPSVTFNGSETVRGHLPAESDGPPVQARQQPVAQQPVVQQPVAQQPVVQQPVVPQPPVMPVAQAPVAQAQQQVQSVPQPVYPAPSQPVPQPIYQPVPVSASVPQPAQVAPSQPVPQPIHQPVPVSASVPQPAHAAPSQPVPQPIHQAVSASVPQPAVASQAGPPAQESFSPAQTRQGIGVPAKPDSVELLRKRTGTPRLGVPVTPAGASPAAMSPPEDPTQAPVAGVIEPVRMRSPTADPISTSSAARAKRPSSGDSQNISGVWFEDDDDTSSRSQRARKTISPSSTDMALYDELPRRRRWGLLIGALAVLIGGVALALTLGRSSSSSKQPAQPAAVPTATADAAPSTIIETPDAAVASAPPAAPDAAAAPPVVARTGTPPVPPTGTGRRPEDLTFTLPPDPGFRRPPGGGSATPPTPIPPPGTGSGSSRGVSGNDTPQDPYGNPDGAAGTPEKQAEFFANLGAQQLGSGDAANAAANFKKALELDPKSASATIGMGEIALRQGLFGDALAHLQKASRLAPRSARVFTLLGEAFLALGKNPDAAANFKKALQIDPDNTRARDGFNEASSRVPPPTDE